MAKRTKKTLKEYRSLYAKAKKKGLVKGDKDARSIKPTRYMKSKLNELEPFLTSDFTSVKVNKQTARAYRDNPSRIAPMVSNDRVLVRKEKGAIATVRKGAVVRVRKLKNGQHEEIVLPFEAKTIREFRQKLRKFPAIEDQIKHERETFAFRLYGNASYRTYPSLKRLFDDLEAYNSFRDQSEEFYKGIVLFRQYKNWDFPGEREELKKVRRRETRKRNKKRLSGKAYEKLRERNRKAVAKWRANNPERVAEHTRRQRFKRHSRRKSE